MILGNKHVKSLVHRCLHVKIPGQKLVNPIKLYINISEFCPGKNAQKYIKCIKHKMRQINMSDLYLYVEHQ